MKCIKRNRTTNFNFDIIKTVFCFTEVERKTNFLDIFGIILRHFHWCLWQHATWHACSFACTWHVALSYVSKGNTSVCSEIYSPLRECHLCHGMYAVALHSLLVDVVALHSPLPVCRSTALTPPCMPWQCCHPLLSEECHRLPLTTALAPYQLPRSELPQKKNNKKKVIINRF